MEQRKRFSVPLDVIPIAIVFVLTLLFTVEVPYSDDWDLVPILAKMHQGALNWQTLDAPYAGHKMVFSYLLMGNVAALTHWSTFAFRIVTLLLLLGAWLAVRPYAARHGRLIEAAILFWSWNQWAVWMWSWMISETMAVFCVLWSLRLLDSRRPAAFIGALLLGFIGSLSFGGGLALWPAALYLVFAIPRPWPQKAAFIAFTLFVAAVFLQHPGPATGEIVRGKHYLEMPISFLAGLGAPVGPNASIADPFFALVGLALLGLSLPELKKEPFLAALILAGITMVGLLAVSRGGSGSYIGLTDSRYGTMSALFWAGLIPLVQWTGWKRWILWLILFCCLVRSVSRLPDMEKMKTVQEAGARALEESKPAGALLKGTQTTPRQFDEDVQWIKSWHYSVFHGS
ncbi:MAG TPA: hypothetical protein VHY22_15870 [Chthoniobacteraceae bacterium]|jgi:hypothetical protein|nr:hypothetical protein [Chthoniobacteraceae bacterium]